MSGKSKQGGKPQKEQKPAQASGETMLGIESKKDVDFGEWYSQVCLRAELMELAAKQQKPVPPSPSPRSDYK